MSSFKTKIAADNRGKNRTRKIHLSHLDNLSCFTNRNETSLPSNAKWGRKVANEPIITERYVSYLDQCRGLLPEDELVRIWLNIDADNQDLSAEDRLLLSLETAFITVQTIIPHTIEAATNNLESIESVKIPSNDQRHTNSTNGTSDASFLTPSTFGQTPRFDNDNFTHNPSFETFEALFDGLLDHEKVDSIWNLMLTSPAEEEDETETASLFTVYTNAVLYALDELLVQNDEILSSENVLLVKTDSEYARELQYEEQQEYELHIKNIVFKNQHISSQRAALDFVEGFCNEHSIEFKTEKLKRILKTFQYDVEATIEYLLDQQTSVISPLPTISFVRKRDVSYKDMISRHNGSIAHILVQNGKTSDNAKKSSSNKADSTAVVIGGDAQNLIHTQHNHLQHEYLHPSLKGNGINVEEKMSQLVRHFVLTLQRNNPSIVIRVTDTNQLLFRGYGSVKDLSNEAHIDLHGLNVQHALQILQTSLNFYRKILREKRMSHAKETMLITYVVGVGNHSVNRIAKIGPAVENHLRKEDKLTYLTGNGMITVKLL